MIRFKGTSRTELKRAWISKFRVASVGWMFVVVAFFSFLAELSAQPVPKISSISKAWIQRGTTVDLTIAGEHLENPERIIISGPGGITATIVPPTSTAAQIESSLGGISSITRQD